MCPLNSNTYVINESNYSVASRSVYFRYSFPYLKKPLQTNDSAIQAFNAATVAPSLGDYKSKPVKLDIDVFRTSTWKKCLRLIL